MPTMHPVESRAIAAVGYDREQRELHVRFMDEDLYVYFGVDEALFRDLLAADSKGTYVNTVIKPRGFAYEQRA